MFILDFHCIMFPVPPSSWINILHWIKFIVNKGKYTEKYSVYKKGFFSL